MSTQQDAANQLNQLTDRVKSMETKINTLVTASQNQELTPELQAAIDALSTEINTADSELPAAPATEA